MSYIDKFYKDFTRQQAVESCVEIVRPNFFKVSLPNAEDIQKSLPDFLQTKWSKLLEDVDKNQAILEFLLKATFKADTSGIVSATQLNINSVTKAQVTMIFGGFRNKAQHSKYVKLAANTLGDEFIVVEINSNETSNREAESKVKKVVARAKREGKRVVIISKDMASRSFSIPEIDTVFLMFDGGLLSQTIQKVSRAFTTGKTYSGEEKQTATIVTLSLDSNRETVDPIDLYVIAEANRIQENNESLQESIRRICMSTNIFISDIAYGALELDSDEYAEKLISNTSVLTQIASSLAIDKLSDIDFTDAILSERSSSTSSRIADNITVDISKVKTTLDPKETKEREDQDENVTNKEMEQFLKNVIFLINNIGRMSDIENYENTNLKSIIDNITLKSLQHEVESFYGLKFDTITRLVEEEKIPVRLLNTVLDGYEVEELTF